MKERRQVARDRKVEGFRGSGADEKKLKCPRSSAKNSAMKKKTLLSLFALVLCVPVAGTLFFLPSFSVAAFFVVNLAAGFRAAADFFRGDVVERGRPRADFRRAGKGFRPPG